MGAYSQKQTRSKPGVQKFATPNRVFAYGGLHIRRHSPLNLALAPHASVLTGSFLSPRAWSVEAREGVGLPLLSWQPSMGLKDRCVQTVSRRDAAAC